MERLVMRIQAQDFSCAQRLRAFSPMSVGGLGFDLGDQFTDPLPFDSRVQMIPTRQWAEAHPFRLAEPRRGFLGLWVLKALLGSIDPDASKLVTSE